VVVGLFQNMKELGLGFMAADGEACTLFAAARFRRMAGNTRFVVLVFLSDF
jgi:hypothetical protein